MRDTILILLLAMSTTGCHSMGGPRSQSSDIWYRMPAQNGCTLWFMDVPGGRIYRTETSDSITFIPMNDTPLQLYPPQTDGR